MTSELHIGPRQSYEGRINRRAMLRIVGAAVALPVGVLGLRELGRMPAPIRWHGEAMNAPAQLTLWHPDPGFARRTLARVAVEVERLESIFSLYRADSEVARLNAAGRLAAPSRDLVAVLELTQQVAAMSGGAFDPTVQPLWVAYAAHFARPGAAPEGPGDAVLAGLRARIGYVGIDARPRIVRLAVPGMAITLNGVAQGYITDRIADLLRNEGFAHAMVEMGETRALGTAPDGRPFAVNLIDPDAPGRTNRRLELDDAALSVSGGYGMRFGETAHHIFDPATGRSARRLGDVAVMAPRAVLADVLSTAIYVGGEAVGLEILAEFPAARAWITRIDGTSVALTL